MGEDVENLFDKKEHCGHLVSGVDTDGNETEYYTLSNKDGDVNSKEGNASAHGSKNINSRNATSDGVDGSACGCVNEIGRETVSKVSERKYFLCAE